MATPEELAERQKWQDTLQDVRRLDFAERTKAPTEEEKRQDAVQNARRPYPVKLTDAPTEEEKRRDALQNTRRPYPVKLTDAPTEEEKWQDAVQIARRPDFAGLTDKYRIPETFVPAAKEPAAEQKWQDTRSVFDGRPLNRVVYADKIPGATYRPARTFAPTIGGAARKAAYRLAKTFGPPEKTVAGFTPTVEFDKETPATVAAKDAEALAKLAPSAAPLKASDRIGEIVPKNDSLNWRGTVSDRAKLLENSGFDTTGMKTEADITGAWGGLMQKFNDAGVSSISARIKAKQYRDAGLSADDAMDASIKDLKQEQVKEQYSRYSWYKHGLPDVETKARRGETQEDTRSQKEYRLLIQAMADPAIKENALSSRYIYPDGRINVRELSEKLATVTTQRILDKYKIDVDAEKAATKSRETETKIRNKTVAEFQREEERRIMLSSLRSANGGLGAKALDEYLLARDQLEKAASTTPPGIKAGLVTVVEEKWKVLGRMPFEGEDGKKASLQMLALDLLSENYTN